MANKKYVIGCDCAAVELKDTLIDYLKSLGKEIEDVGVSASTDDTYYPYIAKRVCEKVLESNGTKEGILICGTGLGMAISANKFKGIRATVCHDIYSAERSKLSNDANVICLGTRVIGVETAKKMIDVWTSLEFVDGSSTPKVAAMDELDEGNFK